MTKDEAIAILKVDGCGYCTWQSLNPCVCENKECELKEAFNMAISALERQTGEWIDREVYDADRWKCCRWKCSECGRTELYKENFCPNCGAKMVESQESEDKK